jgi:hypothetical protein
MGGVVPTTDEILEKLKYLNVNLNKIKTEEPLEI